MIEIFVDAPMELQVLLLAGLIWTRNVIDGIDSNSNRRNYSFYYYK